MDVIHAGEDAFTGSILSYIRSSIETADVVVAIVTDENGNVYYEIGLAHCQKKPVVLLTTDPTTLKFDLRDHRAVVYDPDRPDRALEELTRILAATQAAPKDPKAFIAEKFGGAVGDQETAFRRGLDKIVRTIAEDAGLQSPVELKEYRLLEQTNELAVRVVDFLGNEARAIVDVNGIVRVLKRVST